MQASPPAGCWLLGPVAYKSLHQSSVPVFTSSRPRALRSLRSLAHGGSCHARRAHRSNVLLVNKCDVRTRYVQNHFVLSTCVGTGMCRGAGEGLWHSCEVIHNVTRECFHAFLSGRSGGSGAVHTKINSSGKPE